MRYLFGMPNTEMQSNWIPDTASFGARLALVRWRMGWNLAEAERECGLTQNTWGGYEDGREPRRFGAVTAAIVLRTGVNKMWLMTGEGSPEPERPLSDYSSDVSAPVTDITAARARRSTSGEVA